MESVAQTFSSSVTFGNTGQYSFDYSIVCDSPPTSATLTVTFTTAPPPGLTPQLHLGGGVFVSMSGTGPYTYDFTGMVNCDFSFFFYMAYQGGGLYQSSEAITPYNTPLPIHLTVFSVTQYEADAAELKWTSASEINSDYFSLERSTDGQNWDVVGEVPAAGNSSSIISYRFVDKDLPISSQLSTLFYYRLHMIDRDGSYEYSEIRSVQINRDISDLISVYPNPTQDLLTVEFNGIDLADEHIELSIYSSGRAYILNKQIHDEFLTVVDLRDLPAAAYILVLLRDKERIGQWQFVKGR